MKHEFCYFEIQTKIIVTVIIRAFKYPCVLKFIGLRKFKWIRLRGLFNRIFKVHINTHLNCIVVRIEIK